MHGIFCPVKVYARLRRRFIIDGSILTEQEGTRHVMTSKGILIGINKSNICNILPSSAKSEGKKGILNQVENQSDKHR